MSVSDQVVQGFAIVPNWLVRDTSIDRNIIAVYVALASRASRDGVCWPSRELLAAEAGMSVSTVRRTLGKMRVMGLVDWTHEVTERGQRNRYTLVLYETNRLPLLVRGSGHHEPRGQVTMN